MRTARGQRSKGGRFAGLASVILALAVTGAGPADSPVADAAERGDVEAVRALLRDGADVNTAQSDGMTALHWAATRNDAEIAGILLYAGATPRATTRLGGYTPLHLASRSGSPDVAELILAAGADPNVFTTTGVTAMHFAADADAAAVVALLAAHGADTDARDTFSERTPLMFAAVRGADAASEGALFWVAVNSIPAAIGAALALAHPLTILAAFLSAPFTSLTPVVGTGYVTAFVQAWVRPPRVFELRELKADALVPRRWFRNRALKIALALILPTIGSIFGTFVGGSRLISGALGG